MSSHRSLGQRFAAPRKMFPRHISRGPRAELRKKAEPVPEPVEEGLCFLLKVSPLPVAFKYLESP